jgi:hypothetical protein
MISTRFGIRSGFISFARFAAAAALAILAAGPAAASSLLLSHDHEAVRLLDVTTLPPVAHGPYLTDAFGGGDIETVLTLRDQGAALVLTDTQLHRLVLASPPAAPTIALSITPPFDPSGLIGAGLRDFSLLFGSGGELAVVDNQTLEIRDTFTLPSRRIGGALSPDGRTLASIDLSSGTHATYVSTFDPILGPGTQSPVFTVLTSGQRFAFFSPDGRTLNIILNQYFFDLAEGPAYYVGILEPFVVTGPGLVAQDAFITLGSDATRSHVYGRDGKQLYLPQDGNFMVNANQQLLRLSATVPGSYTEGTPLTLKTQGLGHVARSAGAKRIYFTAADAETLLYLHDPAAGTTASFDIPDGIGNIQAVETGAGVFADGFETGGLGSWTASFP